MTQSATVGTLRLVCKKCRRFEDIQEENRQVAAIRAQARGWEFKFEGGEICPRCVKPIGPSARKRK